MKIFAVCSNIPSLIILSLLMLLLTYYAHPYFYLFCPNENSILFTNFPGCI